MSNDAQPERAIHHQDDHDESRNRDTPSRSGRVDETNEPDEAEAVDSVTPNNEPEEDASDGEKS